jgi:hypothetical protein
VFALLSHGTVLCHYWFTCYWWFVHYTTTTSSTVWVLRTCTVVLLYNHYLGCCVASCYKNCFFFLSSVSLAGTWVSLSSLLLHSFCYCVFIFICPWTITARPKVPATWNASA